MPAKIFELLTLDHLEEIRKELAREERRLHAMIVELREDRIEALEVSSNKIRQRGLEYVSSFIDKVREGHLRIREARGAFGPKSTGKRKA